MTPTLTSDRRTNPRHCVVKSCKIRDRRTARYSPGQTADISHGGALIRVDRARAFGPGDELDLVVAWGDGVVLPAEALVRAIVRRVTPIDHHHQALAVQFADHVARTATAPRAPALAAA